MILVPKRDSPHGFSSTTKLLSCTLLCLSVAQMQTVRAQTTNNTVTSLKADGVLSVKKTKPATVLQVQTKPDQDLSAKSEANLTEEEKYRQELKILQKSRVEDALKEKVAVDVQNASIQDVTEQLKKTSKMGLPIVLRDVGQVMLNFAVADVTAEELLKAIATLAGCQLYILPDSFLIAPPRAVLKNELAYDLQQKSVSQAGNTSRKLSIQNLPRVDAHSSAMASGLKIFPVRLGEAIRKLGPDKNYVAFLNAHQRNMLQRLIDWQCQVLNAAPVNLYPEAKLEYTAGSDGQFNLTVFLDSAGRRHVMGGTSR